MGRKESETAFAFASAWTIPSLCARLPTDPQTAWNHHETAPSQETDPLAFFAGRKEDVPDGRSR